MNQTSVALSDGHRRAPSPEYWLSWTPFPITPRTWTNHLHRCSPLSPLLKQLSFTHSLRSLVLPRLTFWALFLYSVIFPCMTLDCLPLLILCLVILLLEIPIVLLPALTPARYCLRLCLASDIPDTVVWSLPVWPCLSLLKWDCKWIHMPQTLRYRRLRQRRIQQPCTNSLPKFPLKLSC